MNQYHIPSDLISENGEDDLHNKIHEDKNFSIFLKKMIEFLDNTIENKELRTQIIESSQLVYIYAEIAAYREGFKEGIRFLSHCLANPQRETSGTPQIEPLY